MSSVNHHYIPQLYLRGFTSSDGKLQVFDKYLHKFKKDKQTPKTVLYEKHRNTIEFKGIPSDQVEKLYSTIESSFGCFFHHIRKGISHEELISKQGLYLLKLFVAFQFWRMPLTDRFSDIYINNLDLNKFGDKITFGGVPLGEIEMIKELLKSNERFRHYFRSFFLPLLTFDFRIHDTDLDCWCLHTVSDEDAGWGNFLTGDNPIIIENMSEIFSFRSKFFMPLSKNQLISYSPTANNKTDFSAIISTKLTMVMNSQCQKYLVGENREYMEKMLKLQGDVYGDDGVGKLREELFEQI